MDLTDADVEKYGHDLFSNHPKFLERRAALLNDVQHADCNTCWQLENNGFQSSRYDDNFIEMMNQNVGLNFKTVEEVKAHPNIEMSNYARCIEIVLNNVCDAKCTYCNEMFSTSWYKEKIAHGDKDLQRVPEDKRSPVLEESFWKWYEAIGMTHLWRFGFIGGEPFIVDALYEYLEKLIEIHKKHPSMPKKELCITSNMNTPKIYFDKFLEFVPELKKYFHIIIQASGENLGEELEYIRSGVKFDRWKSNIETFANHPDIQVNFLPTLNLLGLPGLAAYLNYWRELCEKIEPISIFENIVTWPKAQSPINAPREFAKCFDEPIKIVEEMIASDLDNGWVNDSWKVYLRFLNETKSAIEKNKTSSDMKKESMEFFLYFNQLDERRKTSLPKSFPDFESFFNQGRSEYEDLRQKSS